MVFENVRVPITEHVLTYACGKMLGGFADIAGIKARILKIIRHFAKRYCKSIDMKLVFSSFKIGIFLGVNDAIPRGIRASVIYKFLCAG